MVTLTLNRPDQFNALSEELLDALGRSLADIATDDQVRCVVLAANGRAFCAGHDLKQMRANCDQRYYEQLFASCGRSEEHTSELQSLLRTSYAVFCLKKKKQTTQYSQ